MENEFMENIENQKIDWASVNTAIMPANADVTPVDRDYESGASNVDSSAGFKDAAMAALDCVLEKQEAIRLVCLQLNDGVFNSLKQKTGSIVKIDDAVVFEKVIDSTIKYKRRKNFNDLYSLYRRLNDKDIRKFCYTEIRSLYAR